MNRNFDIKLGDVVFANRALYRHYGVCTGENEIAHFAASPKCEIDASTAEIRLTTFEGFFRGASGGVESHSAKFPPKIVAKRAKSMLGRNFGAYNLLENNCEHFAHWCRYGEIRSRQVDDAKRGAAVVLSAAVAIALTLLLDKIYSESDEA